jgi:hypothetical protein
VIQENIHLNGNQLNIRFSQGAICSPLFSLLYINDIPNIISDISNQILFSDYKSIIFTNSHFQVFKKDLHSIIIQLISCIKSILLSLSLNRTQFLQFLTENSHESDLQISCENKQISKIYITKFLGLTLHCIARCLCLYFPSSVFCCFFINSHPPSPAQLSCCCCDWHLVMTWHCCTMYAEPQCAFCLCCLFDSLAVQ